MMVIPPSGSKEKTLDELFYSIDLYPNPAKEQTRLKWEILDELDNCQYKVHDMNGAEIATGIISENKGNAAIDTQRLKNGLYLITIENSGLKKQVVKLIVQDKN